MAEIKVWKEFYQYSGLDPSAVRKGCEPRLIVDDNLSDNAIVLIHGLTDSPFFMEAIGKYFHDVMGFNVFIPLLSGHGLVNPNGMRDASVEKWLRDIDFAVTQAQAIGGKRISIGGLSTGGTLSVHRAFSTPYSISGGVFLFSAALDLLGKTGHMAGELETLLLRLFGHDPILANLDEKTSLIGPHPYRYAHMDIHGARCLATLIGLIRDEMGHGAALQQPVFVGHSEADETANIEGVRTLRCAVKESFWMNKSLKIPHASVVLKDEIRTENGKPLEPPNPCFSEMMQAAHTFVQHHLERQRVALQSHV